MNKRMRVLVLLSMMLILIGGCIAYQAEDGTTKYRLLPGIGSKIEGGGQGAIDLLTALSPLLGPAGGIAIGGLVTGLSVFKKMRPQLEEAQNKYELSHTVAGMAVEAIEEIKAANPKLWDEMAIKLRKECEEAGIDTKIVKNFIRGLRGLPVKP